MLTRLFCLHSPEIAKNHDALMALAVSFGQGLQMTNILKDVWEDYRHGACWLPRKIFADEGFDLRDLTTARNRQGFERGVHRLVGIAHRHLRNALAYTLLIPKQETGIRNFCLWAIGLAVLTLRKINNHLDYTDGSQVKISRLSVKGTILATQLTATKRDSPEASFLSRCMAITISVSPNRLGITRYKRRSSESGTLRSLDGLTSWGTASYSAPITRQFKKEKSTVQTVCTSLNWSAQFEQAARRAAWLATPGRVLVFRAGGRLYHPGRVYPDDALYGRGRIRSWRENLPRTYAPAKGRTAVGLSTTVVPLRSVALSKPTMR